MIDKLLKISTTFDASAHKLPGLESVVRAQFLEVDLVRFAGAGIGGQVLAQVVGEGAVAEEGNLVLDWNIQ